MIRVRRSSRNATGRSRSVDRWRANNPNPTKRRKTRKSWTMPFGRHAGCCIEKIPVGYLRWMVREGHRFADKARRELRRRKPEDQG